MKTENYLSEIIDFLTPGRVIIDCIQFPSLKFGTFPISKFGTFPISKFGMFPTSKFGTFLI